jgi:hypothetical protein
MFCKQFGIASSLKKGALPSFKKCVNFFLLFLTMTVVCVETRMVRCCRFGHLFYNINSGIAHKNA